jgi:E3 ubiquitin-protein ligase DOA10
MNNDNKDPRKITCKICYTPVKITNNLVKMNCMCNDDIRIIHRDRLLDVEYVHLIHQEKN